MFDETPLHKAIDGGHLDVVDCLVKNKADKNSPTKGVDNFRKNRLLFIMLFEIII